VDVVLKIYEGLPHAFYICPDLPASVQYFQSMVDWIEQLLPKVSSKNIAG
jgi:hypothetical protein